MLKFVDSGPRGVPNDWNPGEPPLHVVVPVYNEAENFSRFYDSLQANVETQWDLLVVYDSEEDTTLSVARKIAAVDPRVELVLNESKGVLGALKTGLRRPSRGWVLVTMADGSDDHRQVDEMLQLGRKGVDLVAASRYMAGGAQHGAPRLKSILSRFAGVSLHLLTGLPTSDPTSNYKLYSVDLLRSVEIESTGGFEVALEITVKAHLQGRKIAEVPTVWNERTAGRSNFKLFRWLPRYLRWYFRALAG